MQVPDILKVIYAPHKAVKEIAEHPTYLGPILVAILFVATTVGFAYVSASKTYFEQTLPDGSNGDVWTENSALWNSTATITNSSDSISNNLTYPAGSREIYGKTSINFSEDNTSQLSMELNSIGSVNCSSPDGYDKISFRLKQINPRERPENVTIYLYSDDVSDYFSRDLTQSFFESTPDLWNNLTDSHAVPLVNGWSSSGSAADWANITGLKLEFKWLENENVTLLLDGLFFIGPFKSSLEIEGSGGLLSYGLGYAMQFVITWVILGGVFYLLAKTLGAKIVWRPTLIVVGCILVTMVVLWMINLAVFSSLPDIRVPFSLLGGIPGEGQDAANLITEQTGLVSMILGYIHIATYVWIVALCGLSARLLGELTWTKSFLAAVVALFATIFIAGFLGFSI